MRGGLCCAGLFAALLFTTPSWGAGKPRREGFTGDLGLGAALTVVGDDRGPDPAPPSPGGPPPPPGPPRAPRDGKPGLAPLSVSLGGFLSPKFALLFRLSGTSYFEDGDQMGHSFVGGVVEVWLHDRFYVSGGPGYVVFGPNPLFSDSEVESVSGWGLDLRAGVALINGRNHDLTLSAEFIPGFYEDVTVQGYALVAAWKWY